MFFNLLHRQDLSAGKVIDKGKSRRTSFLKVWEIKCKTLIRWPELEINLRKRLLKNLHLKVLMELKSLTIATVKLMVKTDRDSKWLKESFCRVPIKLKVPLFNNKEYRLLLIEAQTNGRNQIEIIS